jgi:hypothetical protein
VMESFGLLFFLLFSLKFVHFNCFITDSFFYKHPDIQQRYFPHVSVDDLEKLRFHGARVVRDISALVRYVVEGNDAKFVEKVQEVRMIPNFAFLQFTKTGDLCKRSWTSMV